VIVAHVDAGKLPLKAFLARADEVMAEKLGKLEPAKA
jgi:hypothetical protein